MIHSRILTSICGLVLTAALALAQAPAPAVPPQPPAAPAPAAAPRPAPAPMAPFYMSAPDWFSDAVREKMALAQDKAQLALAQYARLSRTDSDDRLYQDGQRALDSRHWDQALEDFNQVAARAGSRADGAIYWKAYTLNKLGRRDEAMAAIAELRKSYASSRWLDDAKALEVEVKQAAGQKVSPESESDEDLKLMAINGLMQSDSERAIPLLENLLKGAQSPKLKERALFVLAQSSVPKAQQLLEQVARGGGNPDLQVKAITYVGVAGRKQGAGNGQLLSEIYASTNDANVKRAILSAYMANRDTEHLLQVAKTEKTSELRIGAIRFVGSSGGGDALVAIYASDQDKQVKQTIVETLFAHSNAKALVDLARNEKDAEMKKTIVRYLSTMKGKEATDYLMELLK
ncbi:MAG: HEAT repeat domain-containing protein [Bryobacteraceae bacterium]